MAILFDAASNSGYQTAQSSYNWNHTCGGSDDILLVGVAMLSVAGSSVSSITYDGIALTLVGARASVSGAVRAELWKLEDPPTGSPLQIAVTLSAGLDSIGGAVSLSNVVTTSATEAEADNQGTVTGTQTYPVSTTTVTDNDFLVNVLATTNTSVSCNDTQRTNVSGTLGSGGMGTSGPIHPASSQTMSWLGTGAAGTFAIVAVGVKPLVPDTLMAQISL